MFTSQLLVLLVLNFILKYIEDILRIQTIHTPGDIFKHTQARLTLGCAGCAAMIEVVVVGCVVGIRAFESFGKEHQAWDCRLCSRVNLLKCLGLKPQSIWACLIIGDTTEFPVSSGISTGIIGILGYFLCFQANLAKPIN